MGSCAAIKENEEALCADLERYKARPWLCTKEIKVIIICVYLACGQGVPKRICKKVIKVVALRGKGERGL